MARKKPTYDRIHTYIERVEDVLLSDSSWSTTDSECSGCIHLETFTPSDSENERGNYRRSTYRKPVDNVAKCNGPVQSVHRVFGSHKSLTDLTVDDPLLSADPDAVVGSSGVCCLSSTLGLTSEFGAAMLQQLALLGAGAQPWHHSICTAHGRRFAYAATLAIYVYESEEGRTEWQLCSILADHRKTITCLDWHPTKEDILASASLDQRVCVWSVSRQCVLHAISICRIPAVVAWCNGHRDLLSFSTECGPIQLWAYTEATEPYAYREEYGYANKIITYRWHPNVPGRLVIGHEDGRITLYREDAGKVKYSATPGGVGDTEEEMSELITLEWDQHSPDYLLLGYKGGSLWLVDVTIMKIITKFVLPVSASVSTLSWLPDAPGMFVTGDSEKGILRVWTVSKPTPVENFILKDTGFQVLCTIQASACTKTHTFTEGRLTESTINIADHQPERSTELALDRRGAPAIPNVSVVTLFKDGGVGLYHPRRKQWIFQREHGHTETIFDCSFKPEDSDLLATASFDGSVKIWSIDTMEAVDTLPNRQAIIYSLSWAPANLNCIVAGTSGGEVFIWDISKQKVVQEIRPHKDKKVYCVAWNQKDSRRIASVGESCVCFIHQVDGTMVQDYRHQGQVYGCDWRDADILATGCEDGRIRIFDVRKHRKEPVTELRAHQKKVFRVKWNPVYEDILCSGSDDTSVRIWSYSKAQCLGILVGHSDNVRGLAWCPEVPFLLISGSWDRTMRVWDARHSTCLDVVLDHGADVYGLSIHPLRPFLLASCSRDSTLRLWSLASFVAPLQLKYLCGKPVHEIIADRDMRSNLNTGLMLSGLRGEHLQMALKKTEAPYKISKRLKLFADLFCADVRARNLWDLVYVLQGHTDISFLSPNYTSSVIHHSHLVKCCMSSASEQELDLERGRGVGSRHRSTSAAQDQLAASYLHCGALRQYCELMMKQQKWDHALAIAPAVSVDYWRQLMARHAEQLLADDNEACVAYLLATRDADSLVNFHISRGHLDEAFAACVALSKRHRNKKGPPPDIPTNKPSNFLNINSLNGGVLRPAEETDARSLQCAVLVAEWHLNRGSPIIAACAMLAIDHVKSALLMLLRGHEAELVVVVGRLLVSDSNNPNGPHGSPLKARTSKDNIAPLAVHPAMVLPLISAATRYLTYRAFRLGHWELAVDLANTLPQGAQQLLLIGEILLSFVGGLEERESIYTYAGFPIPAECGDKATGSITEEVMYLMLSTEPHKGITKAIEYLKDAIVEGRLMEGSIWSVLCLLQAAPISQSSGPWVVSADQKMGLLVVSSYFGAIRAAILRYDSIVSHLFQHSSQMLEKHNPSACDGLDDYIKQSWTLWEEQGRDAFQVDVQENPELWCDEGLTRVSGSHLPRHSDSHICCVTKKIIKGPSYFLENGESVMGLNDALMWSKVHPFSPLGTGQRLNPF